MRGEWFSWCLKVVIMKLLMKVLDLSEGRRRLSSIERSAINAPLVPPLIGLHLFKKLSGGLWL